MITTLLIHVFISTVCLITGVLVYDMVDGQEKNRSWLLYLLTGLLTIVFLSQLLSLFVPVNGISSSLVVWCIFLLAFFKRKKMAAAIRQVLGLNENFSPWSIMTISAAWILILVLNSGPVTMDDTHSYHIQMIRWAHEYGTVPGIANLHERFGFNSSWFTAISFFLFPTGTGDQFTALNGCLSFWFLVYCLQQITKKNNALLNQAGWLLLTSLMLFCWPMIRGNATNTNYDFITAVCVFVMFLNTLSNKKATWFEWLYWPVVLFTIRIINYPLLLCSLWVMMSLFRQKKWKPLLAFPLFALLITGSFIARNILLSGYPFYPSTAFNWFAVDWKADQAIIAQLQDFIRYFNRINVQHLNLDETRRLGFPNWIFKWFFYLFRYDKPVVIASLAGMAAYPFLWKKISREYSPSVHFFAAVMLIQLLSWFFIAPDPRFAYGSLLVFVWVLLQTIQPWFKKMEAIPMRTLSLFLLVGLLVLSVAKWRDRSYRNWINPASLPQPPVTTVQVGKIDLYIPEKILNNWNPRCYDTKLPCLYIVDPRLESRGDRVTDGFRLAK